MPLRIAALAGSWPALWLLALGLEGVVGSGAAWLAGRHGPALLATLLNLLICLRFAATLRPGRVPLISRYARHDPAGLPPRVEAYTRGLTRLWAVVLGLFALAHAATLAGAWTVGPLATLQAAGCTALFLGEHALRSRRFPELGRATPWRTFRAIRLAARAPHAA